MTVTYNLCGNSDSAAGYYKTIEKITPMLLRVMNKKLHKICEEYRQFIKKSRLEKVRTNEEYQLELLVYAGIKRHFTAMVDYEMDLEELVDALAGEDEYREEYERLKNWSDFLREREQKDIEEAASVVLKEAIRLGNEHLIKYLPNVGNYIKRVEEENSGRKDFALVSRPEYMYYINMFGAEILSNLYRSEFLKTETKYIFLPGCMTYMGDKCQAKQEKDGLVCAKCCKDCPINTYSEEGENNGFKVRILYHESEMNNKEVKEVGKIGVIGVACVLNLISGGFKAKRLGYVPQCVILNECGCKNHWDTKGEGIRTDVLDTKLISMMK